MATATPDNDLALIELVEDSISRPQDRQDECELSCDLSIMIEEMAPTCQAIWFLGILMLEARENDVSLNERPPQGGFHLIHQPHSLRASLIQVSTGANKAFMEAHVNMEKIHLLTLGLPELLGDVVEATATGTLEDVRGATEDLLQEMSSRARECVELAKGSRGKFIDVMNLIEELLEACASSKGAQEQVMKDKIQRLEVLEFLKQSEEEERRASVANQARIKASVDEARRLHMEALDKLPSDAKVLAVGITEDAVNALTAVLGCLRGFPTVVTAGGSALKTALQAYLSRSQRNEGSESEQTPPVTLEVATVLAVQTSLRLIPQILTSFSDTDGRVTFTEPPGGSQYFEISFNQLSTQMSRSNSGNELTFSTLDITQKGEALCTRLRDILQENSVHGDSDRLAGVRDEFRALLDVVKSIDTCMQQLSGSNPIPEKTPAPKPKGDDRPSALAVIRDNAHFRITQALEQLKLYEQQSQEAEREGRQRREKLNSTMEEIKTLRLEKNDMNKVQKILEKGFRALTDVNRIWNDLIMFFSRLATMVETKFYGDINLFDSKTRRFLAAESDFNSRIMYKYARTATQSTMAIQYLSSMYMKVSSKYVRPRLVLLPGLIYTDPDKDTESCRAELESNCQEAIVGIEEMAASQREEYNGRLRRRLQKIEAARTRLPLTSREEEESNVTAIRRGLGLNPADG